MRQTTDLSNGIINVWKDKMKGLSILIGISVLSAAGFLAIQSELWFLAALASVGFISVVIVGSLSSVLWIKFLQFWENRTPDANLEEAIKNDKQLVLGIGLLIFGFPVVIFSVIFLILPESISVTILVSGIQSTIHVSNLLLLILPPTATILFFLWRDTCYDLYTADDHWMYRDLSTYTLQTPEMVSQYPTPIQTKPKTVQQTEIKDEEQSDDDEDSQEQTVEEHNQEETDTEKSNKDKKDDSDDGMLDDLLDN